MKKLLLVTVSSILTACATTQYPSVSEEGLILRAETEVDAVYKHPFADFSSYKRVQVKECEVAFKRNWQRDQNQSRSLFNHVDKKDMAKIKAELSEICQNSFVAELTKNGYVLTQESAADVLVISPSVVDLDISAPDVSSSMRTTSYATSAGSMRLKLAMHDALSGEVLARAIDKKKARHNGRITWTNSVSNRMEAKRMFERWATMLVKSMNEVKQK